VSLATAVVGGLVKTKTPSPSRLWRARAMLRQSMVQHQRNQLKQVAAIAGGGHHKARVNILSAEFLVTVFHGAAVVAQPQVRWRPWRNRQVCQLGNG
jgi:hypothetical protein